MRPIRRMPDQAMLDRVEMNVVRVRGEISLVADRVFPISPLPDAAFTTHASYRWPTFVDRQSLREGNLDRAPAAGKIVVSLGQGPQPVHMVGKHNPGLDATRRPG